MSKTVLVVLALGLLGGICSPAAAQQPASGPAPGTSAPAKQARATRIPAGSVKLDGRLDEAFWERAQPIADFAQQEPTEGAPPTDGMDVRFVFDETALWIGARMRAEHAAIQAPMSRRDNDEQAEYLLIELDTYRDRRTAYSFGVTASGVRLDHFHPTDNENDTDSEFNPVWVAKTTSDETSWTAEMWLPFSQLRFNDISERIGG